jgi:hypothetical protein
MDAGVAQCISIDRNLNLNIYILKCIGMIVRLPKYGSYILA